MLGFGQGDEVSWNIDRFFFEVGAVFLRELWPIFSNFKKFESGQRGNLTLERGLVRFGLLLELSSCKRLHEASLWNFASKLGNSAGVR